MRAVMLGFIAALGLAGGAAGADEWRLGEEPLVVLDGLQTPESVCPDPETGMAYVSNVSTQTGGFWEEDREGFISRLKADGSPDKLRWRDKAGRDRLNAPKGSCILEGMLYVADITRVCRIPLGAEGEAARFEIPGAEKLNDAATDGTDVYVSDSAVGRVTKLDLSGGGKHVTIPGPEGANGLAFHGEKLYCAAWAAHDVYELDPQGKGLPRPLGLAQHFRGLDGLVALADGSLIVADFPGGKVCLIAPDRRTVTTLVQVQSPADIGFDPQTSRLFIPLFQVNRVLIYKLEKGR